MGHAWVSDLWSSGRPVVMPWLDHVLMDGLPIEDDDYDDYDGYRIGGGNGRGGGGEGEVGFIEGVDSLMVEDNNESGLSAIPSDVTTMGCRSRYGDRELVRLVRIIPHPLAPSINTSMYITPSINISLATTLPAQTVSSPPSFLTLSKYDTHLPFLYIMSSLELLRSGCCNMVHPYLICCIV